MNSERTAVIFRRFKNGGDLVALFPNDFYYGDHSGDTDTIGSYQRIGQHGPASYLHCIAATKPAAPSEYAPLKRELESIGYELDVRVKRSRK